MIDIRHIKKGYPFQQISWVEEGKIITTEKGNKSVNLWSNQDELMWHVQWRDKLAEQTGVITNRMIQTVLGDKALLTDIGWITLHDEVEEPYPVIERPRDIGDFIGNYLSVEMENSCFEQEFPSSNELNLEDEIEGTHFSNNVRLKQFEKVKREALRRIRIANSLISDFQMRQTSTMVAPINSLDQAKIVHGQLFWKNEEQEAQFWYEALRSWLSSWVAKHGTNQVFTLLDGINENFSLKGYEGNVLLASCLYPWEFHRFIDVSKADRNRETDSSFQLLSKEWSEMKQLIDITAHWLDHAREKVPQ